MYITLSNIQNGEPVNLARNLSVPAGGLEVALCELTYYHRWANISAALENNQASNRDVSAALESNQTEASNRDITMSIPDGYYNTCELDEEAFQPLGSELRLSAPTGRLQLTVKKCLVLNSGLAKLLGFTQETFEPGKTYLADEPHRLTIHREIYVHLAEVSTSDNLYNGRPSTLLRSVPVENERRGGGRTEVFPVLLYKRLAAGANSQLTLTVLDVNGKKLSFDFMSATLHIRHG
ncbi:MAG: hypothetical protein AB2653_18590 [Candidatus Thiodiazotropha endolucinida]